MIKNVIIHKVGASTQEPSAELLKQSLQSALRSRQAA
jgi:hypothetical protein